MKKTLRLDPTVAKQLQAPAGHEAEVQRLLDNPQEITHFLDFRVDWAFKYILGHGKLLFLQLPIYGNQSSL